MNPYRMRLFGFLFPFFLFFQSGDSEAEDGYCNLRLIWALLPWDLAGFY